jgi:putative CocE/NonD family hydrolase
MSHFTAYLTAVEAAQAGFAYVCQDLRGRGASDGEWEPFSTEIEPSDGYDCVEWVASESWCDGNVGMIGCSYESFNQFAAAVARPPHLRAIAPQGSAFRARGPITLAAFSVAWSAGMVGMWLAREMQAGRPVDGAHMTAVLDAVRDPVGASQHLPLKDHPLARVPVPGAPMQWSLRDELVLGYVPWETVEVPALFTNGWYDACAPTCIEQFRAMRDTGATAAARDETKLIIGPWDHGSTASNLQEVHFGTLAEGGVAGVGQEHLQFFSRHLRGDTDALVLPTARYFVMGSNVWKVADEWPPPKSEEVRAFLHSKGRANGLTGDGALTFSAPTAAEASDRYDYDPMHPVPAHGVRAMRIGGSPVGPADQRRVEERDDVLVYTSDPVDSELELVGGVRLRLFASTSAVDTDFVVKLCDVSPSGISLNLCDGVVRGRWRLDEPTPTMLEPGEVYEFDIDMGPLAHAFLPGHPHRLQVTSSAFPYWDRNMNTGNEAGEDATGIVARQTVLHDPVHPSHLVFRRAR